MKTNEFESAISKVGLEPKEVRLERNHVKWFICGGNDDYDIIVYDAQGKALVLSSYQWPDEVNDIHIEVYRDKNQQVLGVTIDGKPVMRDDRLDLVFEEESKANKYQCIRCSMFEYCVENHGITGECMSCEDFERVID